MSNCEPETGSWVVDLPASGVRTHRAWICLLWSGLDSSSRRRPGVTGRVLSYIVLMVQSRLMSTVANCRSVLLKTGAEATKWQTLGPMALLCVISCQLTINPLQSCNPFTCWRAELWIKAAPRLCHWSSAKLLLSLYCASLTSSLLQSFYWFGGNYLSVNILSVSNCSLHSF